jgi:hypothetical protein
MKLQLNILFFCALLMSHDLRAGDTLFVNQLANGLKNGTSWQDAFTTVHEALFLAEPGDDIWVAKGKYGLIEARVQPRVRFPSDVRLFGNFEGNETSIDQRILDSIQTIFTHESTLPPDSTFYFGSGLLFSGTGPRTQLNGVMFRTKTAYFYDDNAGMFLNCDERQCRGGAVLMIQDSSTSSTSLELKFCVFDSCEAGSGAGIYGYGNSGNIRLMIDSCVFSNNISLGATAIDIDALNQSTLVTSVMGTKFFKNTAKYQGSTDVEIISSSSQDTIMLDMNDFSYGVGAFPYPSGPMILIINLGVACIKRCKFSNYYSHPSRRIGAIVSAYGRIVIDRCEFANSATLKSLISLRNHNGVISNCLFLDNTILSPDVYNSLINNGHTGFTGQYRTEISNCSFIGNTLDSLGRAISGLGGNIELYIKNCLFSNSSIGKTISINSLKKFEIDHCLVVNHDSLDFIANEMEIMNTPNTLIGSHIIYGKQPLFADTLLDNYQLLSCSPGVNAGDNQSVIGFNNHDLNGKSRIEDGTVDIGAYETKKLRYGTITSQPQCYSSQDGSILMMQSGGALNGTIHWNTGDTLQNLTNLGASQYTYVLTEGKDCVFYDTILLDQPDSMSISVLYGQASSSIALDGSLHITPNGGTMPYEYLWSNGQTTASLTNIAVGAYTLTLSDKNDCTQIFTLNLGTSDVEMLIDQKMELFPNPAQQVLNIKIDPAEGTNHMAFCFLPSGQRVHLPLILGKNGLLSIDIRTLQSGYFLGYLQSDQGNLRHFRFLKVD